MMREGDGRRAVQALGDFYSAGYRVVSNQSQNQIRVDGFFVSDCGILFVRRKRAENPRVREGLEALLAVVEALHRSCSGRAVFLTTSIAWGSSHTTNGSRFPASKRILSSATPTSMRSLTMIAAHRRFIPASAALFVMLYRQMLFSFARLAKGATLPEFVPQPSISTLSGHNPTPPIPDEDRDFLEASFY